MAKQARYRCDACGVEAVVSATMLPAGWVRRFVADTSVWRPVTQDINAHVVGVFHYCPKHQQLGKPVAVEVF